MGQVPVLVAFVVLLLFSIASAITEPEKIALVQFMDTLTPGPIVREIGFGWDITSDPCTDNWYGVSCLNCTSNGGGVFCGNQYESAMLIVLDDLYLAGTIDAISLCKGATDLVYLSLTNNSVEGELPSEISNCRNLKHLQLRNNHLSGSLPASLSTMTNLKTIAISNNSFFGDLPPGLSEILGLSYFWAPNNHFTGTIPDFKLPELLDFDVSSNFLVGPIPDDLHHFGASSFFNNTGLCGEPLANACA